jgi:hypothetical protein
MAAAEPLKNDEEVVQLAFAVQDWAVHTAGLDNLSLHILSCLLEDHERTDFRIRENAEAYLNDLIGESE